MGFMTVVLFTQSKLIMSFFTPDIEVIEKTAQEIDEFLAPWIVRSVTQDIPAWKLVQLENMPATVNEFNAKRRRFYCLLAIRRKMI